MDELTAMVARHDERLDNLEYWQKQQNGMLKELHGEVYELRKHVEERFRGLEGWLRGLMGGMVVSVLLLLLDLLVRGKLP